MTIKLVVLYTQPDDPAAFDEHYLGVHMPLVAKLPGLERAETGKFTMALDGGELTTTGSPSCTSPTRTP